MASTTSTTLATTSEYLEIKRAFKLDIYKKIEYFRTLSEFSYLLMILI